MAGPQRTPPRFVPTLTTVLELPSQQPAQPHEQPQQEPPPPDGEAWHPHAALPEAPPVQEAVPAPAPAHGVALDPHARHSEAEAFRLEEQLLHRVLQRVDLSLEEHVSEVVSAVVQQQLDAMIPRLRDEIEAALRVLVSDALARELSDNTGSTPALRAQTLG